MNRAYLLLFLALLSVSVVRTGLGYVLSLGRAVDCVASLYLCEDGPYLFHRRL